MAEQFTGWELYRWKLVGSWFWGSEARNGGTMEFHTESDLAAKLCWALWATYFKGILYGVFGATWGIDSINKFNAEACNKSSTRDSEREHGADEAYEQLKQVERWPRLERERRGEHSQGDIACASSSATTSIAPPSSSRSPTATEDALLGGEPWGCQ